MQIFFSNTLEIHLSNDIGPPFSIEDLSTFLKSGITFASFNWEGNIPVLKAWVTTNDRSSTIIYFISFRIMHDILSWPELVFIGKLFTTLRPPSSFGLVFLKWIFWKCLENADNDQMDVSIVSAKFFPMSVTEFARNFFFVNDGLFVHF